MSLDEFRQAVFREFGPRLERATPANVREFTARMQARLFDRREGGRFVIGEEKARTYEEIVKDFFAQTLAHPPEQALIALWLMAFELWFAVIELDYAETFAALFEGLE